MSPGPIALRAVEVAESYVGTQETGGNNRGPRVEQFLSSVGLPPGYAWCGAFVRACLERAAGGLNLDIPADFPDSGWTPSYKAWALERGLWISIRQAVLSEPRPQRGDLACFYFAAKGRIAHIGFVAADMFNGGGVTTVEGNTGPDLSEQIDRDGDGVWRKRRAWGAFGIAGGFVRVTW